MRTLVVGDIHGGFKALTQVLGRAKFNPHHDRLISLGDICDGWSQTRETIDFLATLPDCLLILGNHDQWTLDWMKTGETSVMHLSQGGQATIDSYSRDIPREHVQFLESARLYFLDEKNRLYVHAGFEPEVPLDQQSQDIFCLDRSLYMAASHHREKFKIPEYQTVFIGHTPTLDVQPDATPVIWGNLVNLDQGAGWDGRLTVMDADTREFWQSDFVPELYPDEPGRMRRSSFKGT